MFTKWFDLFKVYYKLGGCVAVNSSNQVTFHHVDHSPEDHLSVQ